ncbi:hypothetical protein L873DRAFT_1880904 [Choiromyces venosus 120613-1]|uniref:Uncharacterized protein n=1 Tax=Choiromyces venosus 120613-1 TaxID=1336337 RepID=A0A3N4JZ11_9PEZI|nr:hypothetical protein L873DRAFT_1880904 [Choiromyces venosus 120613-1]
MTISCISDIYYCFHLKKADIIKSVFCKVGLSLPIDGSYDLELNIKNFLGLGEGSNWKEDFGIVDEAADISDVYNHNESIDLIYSYE